MVAERGLGEITMPTDGDNTMNETDNDDIKRLTRIKLEKTKAKSAFTRARRHLVTLFVRVDDSETVDIAKVNEACHALETAQDRVLELLTQLSVEYTTLEDWQNIEKVSAEIDRLDLEFSDSHGQAQSYIELIMKDKFNRVNNDRDGQSNGQTTSSNVEKQQQIANEAKMKAEKLRLRHGLRTKETGNGR